MPRYLQPALAAGCLVLAGCTPSADPGGMAPQPRTAPPAKVADPVFTPDGIAVGDTGREIGFNRAEPGAVAAMAKLMGRAPESLGPACSGLRAARWPDGTTLFFEPRRYDLPAFVGWQTSTGRAGRTCEG